ncbi:hypothetical protein ACA081_00480 [Candidatus Hodgkinia cicadicola]
MEVCLSDEEIQNNDDAQVNVEIDNKNRDIAEIKNQSENLFITTEKSLKWLWQ